MDPSGDSSALSSARAESGMTGRRRLFGQRGIGRVPTTNASGAVGSFSGEGRAHVPLGNGVPPGDDALTPRVIVRVIQASHVARGEAERGSRHEGHRDFLRFEGRRVDDDARMPLPDVQVREVLAEVLHAGADRRRSTGGPIVHRPSLARVRLGRG